MEAAQTLLDTATTEQEARKAAKDIALEALLAKKTEIAEKEQVVSVDAASVRDAEKKLRDAQEARNNADAEGQALGLKQEKCQEMIQGNFQMLKDGSWETTRVLKQKLAALKPYVKDLSPDTSLLDAMSTVFSKKPADRSGFDNKVVDTIENFLDKHFETLGQQRDSAKAVVAEKAVHVDAAGAVVKAAQEKQQVSAAAVVAAQTEQSNLTSVLADAQYALKEHEKTTHQATLDFARHKSSLERLETVRAALVFLRQRAIVHEPISVVQSVGESEIAPPDETKKTFPDQSEKLIIKEPESVVAPPAANKIVVEGLPAPPTMIAAGA